MERCYILEPASESEQIEFGFYGNALYFQSFLLSVYLFLLLKTKTRFFENFCFFISRQCWSWSFHFLLYQNEMERQLKLKLVWRWKHVTIIINIKILLTKLKHTYLNSISHSLSSVLIVIVYEKEQKVKDILSWELIINSGPEYLIHKAIRWPSTYFLEIFRYLIRKEWKKIIMRKLISCEGRELC